MNPGAQPLLGLLPPLVVFEADEAQATGLSLTLALLHHETVGTRPGTETVLARLGDLLLVQMLRSWRARAESSAAGWLPALHDSQLNAASQAMHAQPAGPWTVETLAAGLLREGQSVSRVSRAVGYSSEPAFSRAFRRHFGEPPSRSRPGRGLPDAG